MLTGICDPYNSFYKSMNEMVIYNSSGLGYYTLIPEKLTYSKGTDKPGF